MGKRWRTVDVVVVLVGCLLGLGVVGVVVKNFIPSGPPPRFQDLPLPEQFAITLGRFAASYDAAENDIQRSDAFRAARRFDAQFKANSSHLVDWRGRVGRLSTSHGGDTLTVEVGEAFPVQLTQRGIPSSDSVYLAARGLQRGACVVFSAYLDAEGSLTERGAMREPDYRVRFITLRGC